MVKRKVKKTIEGDSSDFLKKIFSREDLCEHCLNKNTHRCKECHITRSGYISNQVPFKILKNKYEESK
jgi:hypothetical protein